MIFNQTEKEEKAYLMDIIALLAANIEQMDMIAIFGLLSISMNSMRSVISNCGQNMQMEK